MNYRHHFHAGNFADVVKHVFLLALWRRLQAKESGLLFLDTHAGRGAYDLGAAARGDSLAREPEWPEGLGRLEAVAAEGLPGPVADYLAAVRLFRSQRESEKGETNLRYPGSPWIIGQALRPQDRMVLCERHPEEHQALAAEFAPQRRVRVEEVDGYAAIRAHLPPRERRALVLIDPPYEATGEFEDVVAAVDEGLRRLPGGTFVVWYPLTERADVAGFKRELQTRQLPPCWTAELSVVGPTDPAKLKGCGLLVLNPPWQIAGVLAPTLSWLETTLRRTPGGESALRWLVPE